MLFKSKVKTPKTINPKYMTSIQAAAYMGYSRTKFNQLKIMGVIPYTKLPNSFPRYKMSDLDKVLRHHETTSKIYEVSAVI